MKKLEIKIADLGLQCRTEADHPDGTFGTIYTPPYRIKTDALRTGGQQWIMVCEILSK